MVFHIITIFPKIFDSYFNESIVKRAKENKLIEIKIYDLRDYTSDKHRTVDDTVYGGGAGMLLKIEPIRCCVEAIKKKIKNKKRAVRTILLSAKGKVYDQTQVVRLKKYTDIILICGRYEGVDERVAKYIADEEISIGEYVMTGGEIPAMVLVDSISRQIPGVLGNEASVTGESFSKKYFLEYPQYTKPAEFLGKKVPKILLSGNHEEIENWRKKNSKIKKRTCNL